MSHEGPLAGSLSCNSLPGEAPLQSCSKDKAAAECQEGLQRSGTRGLRLCSFTAEPKPESSRQSPSTARRAGGRSVIRNFRSPRFQRGTRLCEHTGIERRDQFGIRLQKCGGLLSLCGSNLPHSAHKESIHERDTDCLPVDANAFQ